MSKFKNYRKRGVRKPLNNSPKSENFNSKLKELGESLLPFLTKELLFDIIRNLFS